MKAPVQIFDEWLDDCANASNDIGRRFHPIPSEIAAPFDGQIKSFKRRMLQIRDKMLPGREIEIYTDFTGKGWCNAAAWIREDHGLIAIAKGAVLLPLELFCRMLSHPAVLTMVGDPKLERIGPQHAEGLPDNYDELVARRRNANQALLWRNPNCPDRNAVAQLMYDLVQRFVAIHEITHIVYGHIGYLQQRGHVACLLEIQHSAVSKANRDLQVMEISADDAAAYTVMNQFVNNPDRHKPGARLPDARTRLFLWSFAMHSLFRLWDFTIDPTDLDDDHPPTPVRFAVLTGGTWRDVAHTIPEIGDEYADIVIAGGREAEKAIRYCGGTPLRPEDVVDDPRVEAHMNDLFIHHDDVLIHEFMKHAHIKITERPGVDHGSPPPPQPQTQP
jgi:hypothetical protein